VNYYLANNAVFVPLFDDVRDEQALEIFREVYPEREIVDLPEAAAVFYGGGGVHCITQQQPAVANERRRK
jgi:agmatine deiminase